MKARDNEKFSEAIAAERDHIERAQADAEDLEIDCEFTDDEVVAIIDRIEAAHMREVDELKNKCEEYERQPELMAETAKAALELLKTQESKIKELRECLRIIRDNLLLYTIKSEDGKYVNNGAFLSEEFIDDERWRKALERTDNENKDE